MLKGWKGQPSQVLSTRAVGSLGTPGFSCTGQGVAAGTATTVWGGNLSLGRRLLGSVSKIFETSCIDGLASGA